MTLLVLLATTLGASATAPPAPTPNLAATMVKADPIGPTRVFSHFVHLDAKLALGCESCHSLRVDGNRSRHANDGTCERCHEKEGVRDAAIDAYVAALRAAPTPVRGLRPPIHQIHVTYPCEKCHSGMRTSRVVGDLPLPPISNTSAVCTQCHGKQIRFSHAEHVAIDGKVAAHCELCHTATAQNVLYATPGHPQCWQCHDITLLGLTAGCSLCHLDEVRSQKSYDIEAASVRHKQHRDVPCAECHAAILTARTLAELKDARDDSSTRSCERCHGAGMK